VNSLKGLEIKGKRKEIMEILEKNPEANEIILKTKPSKFLFVLLLNRTKMKKVFVSRAIYRSVQKKYWKVLEEMGVKIKIEKRRRGRKGYEKKIKRKIVQDAKKKGVSRVARKYGVGRRTIYNWMKEYSE
jgi:hypothetical protein